MRSLSWKLGGALLLMVLVSVGLMAFITNRSTAREFQQYVSYGNLMYAQAVEASLGQFYDRNGGWDGIQGVLGGLLRSADDRIIVADSSGSIVGDTDGNWLGRNAAGVGLSGGEPVIASGREVGRLYLRLNSSGGFGMGHMGGMMGAAMPMMDTAEEDFLRRVNNSLWLAGGIAALVALLLGLVLTRQITRPVRALIRGSRQIAGGDLGHRVEVKSQDELGELAQSFNAMAHSLERGEKSRRQLVADIAHELRTPLTVIEGTVDGIMDGVFAPDAEHLGSIREQTGLLTRLIGELRDLSLAEAGQLKLELAATGMVELLRRKLSQAELAAGEKGVRLGLEVLGEVPEVRVDAVRLEQVIANLLANAVRHTPAGGSVTVSVGRQAGSLVISVADTGEGIAAEHLPHVFERFYRVGSSRSRSDGGAGLGLAIVKQMVQAHGGQVWVESQPGRGSTFHVALPLSG